jgi:hypothetical protein
MASSAMLAPSGSRIEAAPAAPGVRAVIKVIGRRADTEETA